MLNHFPVSESQSKKQVLHDQQNLKYSITQESFPIHIIHIHVGWKNYIIFNTFFLLREVSSVLLSFNKTAWQFFHTLWLWLERGLKHLTLYCIQKWNQRYFIWDRLSCAQAKVGVIHACAKIWINNRMHKKSDYIRYRNKQNMTTELHAHRHLLKKLKLMKY